MEKIEIRIRNFEHKYITSKVIYRELKEKNVWVDLFEITKQMGLVFQSWCFENDTYIVNCTNSLGSASEYYSRVYNP